MCPSVSLSVSQAPSCPLCSCTENISAYPKGLEYPEQKCLQPLFGKQIFTFLYKGRKKNHIHRLDGLVLRRQVGYKVSPHLHPGELLKLAASLIRTQIEHGDTALQVSLFQRRFCARALNPAKRHALKPCLFQYRAVFIIKAYCISLRFPFIRSKAGKWSQVVKKWQTAAPDWYGSL